eukprot:m.855551 g.855551  ORF g.855551 m.855551 type:complete len:335 (+) comp59625_c0_seq25:2626-3630(+)
MYMAEHCPASPYLSPTNMSEQQPPSVQAFVGGLEEELYVFDEQVHAELMQAQPWATEPNYFKKVRVSAIALLKMVTHARSGKNLEVMGIMQGKIVADTFVVMDAFALPVEGTETRVNAHEQAYEYMIGYMENAKKVGRVEHAVGWYHSHPGYGCWLSGIDVATQRLNQQGQDPFVAIVIDPTKTLAAGKVEIGAFRTYPESYKPPNQPVSEYQTVPSDKIEDFGVHASAYYPMEVSFFTSTLDRSLLDLLWKKYWVSTLSSSPLTDNAEYSERQLADVTHKLEHASSKAGGSVTKSGSQAPLTTCAHDASKLALDLLHGVTTQLMKDAIFKKPS